MAIKASIEPVPTKAAAVLLWLDLLWTSTDPVLFVLDPLIQEVRIKSPS